MFDVPQILFLVAAALSAVGAVAHELLGAPKVLGPLKGSGLAPDVIWLHHFSWHVGTVAVAAMVLLFVLAALQPGSLMLAVVATAMSAGFAALGIGLAVFGNKALWRTPAPYPWALIALLGGIGLFSARSAA
jgi:hypothetical protein